jgi:thioredoxin 1
MAQQFNDANFKQEVIEASKNKPVLVDFFAPWCGPCQIQGPIVEQLADEVKDSAIVAKVNTEEAMQVAMEYAIMSIPTLMIFRNGQVVEKYVGLQPKESLAEALKKHA